MFGLNFVFDGQNYNYIFVALGGLLIGEKFEVNYGDSCLRSLQCNVFTEEVSWLFAWHKSTAIRHETLLYFAVVNCHTNSRIRHRNKAT